MAQSPEYPDLLWMPPKSWTDANRSSVQLIVIHTTEGGARGTAAEDGADYDQRRTDGTSTHYFCIIPDMRVLTQSMEWLPAGKVAVGDQLVGFDENAPAGGKRKLQPATVTAVNTHVTERVRITLVDGRVLTTSADHRWLTFTGGNYKWRTAERFKPGQNVCAPLTPWEEAHDPVRAGWLAGIFDGEGCFDTATRALSFAQKEGRVLDQGMRYLSDLGYPHAVTERRESGVNIVALSGMQSTMQFLGQCRPVRFTNRPQLWAGRALAGSRLYPARVEIASVERIEPGEVVSITTTTRTFIAEGVASHNCDSDSTVQCVRTEDQAHAARTQGNRRGIQYELCGKAWEADWGSAYYQAVLRVAAKQAARDAAKWGIPVQHLTVAQVAAGVKGFCGHADITAAFPQDNGTHTDPGPNFPWTQFLNLVRAELAPTPNPPEDEVTPEEIQAIAKAVWNFPVVNPYISGPDNLQPAQTPLRYAPSLSPHTQTWTRIDQLTALLNAFIASETSDDAAKAQALAAIQQAVASSAQLVAAAVIKALPSGGTVTQDMVTTAVEQAFAEAFGSRS